MKKLNGLPLYTIEDVNIPLDGYATCDLTITNHAETTSCDAVITYDPDVIEIVGLAETDWPYIQFNTMTPGEIHILAYSLTYLTGDVLVARIQMKAAPGAAINDSCPLILSGTYVFNNDLPPIYVPHDIQNGVATIIADNGCTNPTCSENITICGQSQYGQDTTHKYKCINGVWVDQGYNSSCEAGGCACPEGNANSETCGDYDFNQNILNKYKCINGIWSDQGYDPDCETTGCVAPAGAPFEERCGEPVFGQDPTHRYKCINSVWVDQGYDPDCEPQPDNCNNPSGPHGQIRCGCSLCGQDPTHKYECDDGTWIDRGYDAACDVGNDCTSPIGAENSEICGESQYGQDPTHRYKCIGGVWVDQGYDAACDTGVDCSSYTNLNDCAQAGCYWYNGACHDNPPSCEILTSEMQCQIYGCYWYNNSCHTNPENGDGAPCSSYINQLDCLNANCYWYKKYPWEAEACYSNPQDINWSLIASELAVIGVAVTGIIIWKRKRS